MENKIRNADNGVYIDIEKTDGEKYQLGSIIQFDFNGKVLSSTEMINWLDRLSTINQDDCNKIGIEKERPYFTKHNAQVFSRSLVCWVDDKPNRHHYFWLVQSKTKLTQFSAVIPVKLEQVSKEQQRKAIEAVSYFLD